jgi:hypothetical protein
VRVTEQTLRDGIGRAGSSAPSCSQTAEMLPPGEPRRSGYARAKAAPGCCSGAVCAPWQCPGKGKARTGPAGLASDELSDNLASIASPQPPSGHSSQRGERSAWSRLWVPHADDLGDPVTDGLAGHLSRAGRRGRSPRPSSRRSVARTRSPGASGDAGHPSAEPRGLVGATRGVAGRLPRPRGVRLHHQTARSAGRVPHQLKPIRYLSSRLR